MLATELVIGDLADETRLPRELIQRFNEMWFARERPFFSNVDVDGMLHVDGLEELIRSLKISVPVLYQSVARVISTGKPITFEQFVRGYAKLHARTLKEALPFAFAVFDLDGDGILGQEEFRTVINANLEMQALDADVINRVLSTAAGKDASGVTYDAFRYFASLSSETILACCGCCLHVRDFYVPLTPLGTEAEEAAEEADRNERRRREREREYMPHANEPHDGCRASDGDVDDVGNVTGRLEDTEVNSFTHPDMLAALESLKTTPEERAERSKTRGNEALKHKKAGMEKAVQHYTEGLDERCVDASLNAVLMANRCAAHTMLKNWGKALADAHAALESGALAQASILKVSRRGAAAALELGKLSEAEAMIARAESAITAKGNHPSGAATGAASGATSGAAVETQLGTSGDKPSPATSGDAFEIIQIKAKVSAAREEQKRRRLEQEARQHVEALTQRTIHKRGYIVGAWEDERLREQCVGAAAGAHVWYDEEEDELHWPLLLLYPEPVSIGSLAHPKLRVVTQWHGFRV